jgi:homoserine kinase
MALDFGDTLTAEVIDDGLEIEVTGEGADTVPRTAEHLVVRAMALAFREMGLPCPGLRLSCVNRIAHSRGMGSSSAAIVGGIRLAVALAADPAVRLDDRAMLELADRIEGHPDNVAPAFLGGFVIAGTSQGELWVEVMPVRDDIDLVLFVPPHGLDTEVARGLIPGSVPHREAAANGARTALLALGLTHDPGLLLRGTEDFLHQEQRTPGMPDSLALVHRLRDSGIPAVVSGAGPTVLAFVVRGSGVSPEDVLAHAPAGWRGSARRPSAQGVRVSSAAAGTSTPGRDPQP